MDRSSTSVVLPTVEWTPVIDQVAAQLRDGDELLVVCDGPSDPIFDAIEALPASTRLVVAGDPTRCSGKANAVAAGMAEATGDRLVWTDDDFFHPPGWLDTLQADYERMGPVSEVPFFKGEDPLALVLEPMYALWGTLGVYLGNKAWGGAVVFEPGDLDIDRETFRTRLQQTVSDDGLLSEYLDVTTIRRTRTVPVGGTFRRTLERHVRFTQIVRHFEPRAGLLALLYTVLGVICILAPVVGFVVSTLLVALTYAWFDVRRWTVVLAYPAMVAQIPLIGYGLLRGTFRWSGRRYRWRDTFDVEICDDGPDRPD